MKRFTLCLLACVVLAGTGWLAHSVWGQVPPEAEKKFYVTQSQLDAYVAKAIAADREKSGHTAGAAVPDEEVLKSSNWHRAVFNKAEWVVYTGPGQFLFHHWVEQKAPPKGGAAMPSTPPSK